MLTNKESLTQNKVQIYCATMENVDIDLSIYWQEKMFTARCSKKMHYQTIHTSAHVHM